MSTTDEHWIDRLSRRVANDVSRKEFLTLAGGAILGALFVRPGQVEAADDSVSALKPRIVPIIDETSVCGEDATECARGEHKKLGPILVCCDTPNGQCCGRTTCCPSSHPFTRGDCKDKKCYKDPPIIDPCAQLNGGKGCSKKDRCCILAGGGPTCVGLKDPNFCGCEPKCPDNESCCPAANGPTCVPQDDPKSCGGCPGKGGKVCGGDEPNCCNVGGKFKCVNLRDDKFFCGATCATAKRCQSPFPDCCQGVCVNKLNDAGNCGFCGCTCFGPLGCQAGKCINSPIDGSGCPGDPCLKQAPAGPSGGICCRPPLRLCGDACKQCCEDAHCPTGETCQDGTCAGCTGTQCPNFCCGLGGAICCTGQDTCCPSDFPTCCAGSLLCCSPQFPNCCPQFNFCCEPGFTVCCPGPLCCSLSFPVCCSGFCCPANTTCGAAGSVECFSRPAGSAPPAIVPGLPQGAGRSSGGGRMAD